MRIGFTGAAGVGKSTLVEELLKLEELKNHKQYNNVQRTLHKNLKNFPHSGLANNISQISITSGIAYQVITEKNIICDRSIIDTFAYAKLAEKVNMLEEIEDTFSEVIDLYDLIIYIPVEFNVLDDGFRDIDMKYIRETDNAIRYYLSKYKVNFLEVRGSVEERMNTIKNTIKDTLKEINDTH